MSEDQAQDQGTTAAAPINYGEIKEQAEKLLNTINDANPDKTIAELNNAAHHANLAVVELKAKIARDENSAQEQSEGAESAGPGDDQGHGESD